MKTKLLGFLAACMVLLGASQAGATVYTVNDVAGTDTIYGFIKTDGSLGVLGSPNIIDFDLLISDGATHVAILGPDSGNTGFVWIDGSGLTATANGLFFDFGATDETFGYFYTYAGASGALCLNNALGSCSGNASALAIIDSGAVSGVAPEQGVVQFAALATPLPAALPLFATGLGGLGLFGWRRKRKNTGAIAAA